MKSKAHEFQRLSTLTRPNKACPLTSFLPDYSLPCPHRKLSTSLLSTPLSNQRPPINKSYSHIYKECANQRLPNAGKQAHAHMIASGFIPSTYVTNCLIHMYIKCSNLDYAHQVFDRMSEPDTISWNSMISGYVRRGLMGTAHSIFDKMPERDVVSWNSLISGYLENEVCPMSVDLFLQMGRSGMSPDHTTLAVVLKSCSAMEDYELGIQIHCLSVQLSFDIDVVTGSALVDMYAKCRRVEDSHRFFDEMPERNWVTWSALIAGYVQNDLLIGGLYLFQEMQQAVVGVSQSAYASVFRSCACLSSLKLGIQIHGHAIKTNFGSDTIVGTAVLDMYAKCDALCEARKVFTSLPKHGVQSWNAMIVGYARNDQGFDALILFRAMHTSGVVVDEITLSSVFSACAGIEGHIEGTQVHCLAIKTSFELNICVANAVLGMYGNCGALVEAHRVFKEMEQRDAVSWNAIISTYEQNGNEEETLLHFSQMLQSGLEPDEFSYGSVLKACASLQALGNGMEIHDRIIKSGSGFDSFVGSALLDMYCKCGALEEAEKLHERLDGQTIVSWNAIISGFSLQKQSEEAQMLFSQMLDMGLKPDSFTYATVLDTCANIATIGLGRQIHAQVVKEELQRDVYIASTLVDMYSKCGNMQDSLLMFEKMPERDVVSWNAMVCGYAQHGHGVEALKVFERMQIENVRPNDATFVAVLRACGFMGLFDEGYRYFNLMTDHYELTPKLEHYSCMVDIIGRSGRIDDALKLIYAMPFEADAVIWRTLLSVCKIHGNIKVAELAASSILHLDPEDSAAYILLSNIYAEAGRWDTVSRMRKMMRQSGLKKEPGCSWIEVKSKVHTFLVGDKAHPRCQEIYKRLDELITEMKWAGYVPDIDFVLNNEENKLEL